MIGVLEAAINRSDFRFFCKTLAGDESREEGRTPSKFSISPSTFWPRQVRSAIASRSFCSCPPFLIQYVHSKNAEQLVSSHRFRILSTGKRPALAGQSLALQTSYHAAPTLCGEEHGKGSRLLPPSSTLCTSICFLVPNIEQYYQDQPRNAHGHCYYAASAKRCTRTSSPLLADRPGVTGSSFS
jgi:hypothetical protein